MRKLAFVCFMLLALLLSSCQVSKSTAGSVSTQPPTTSSTSGISITTPLSAVSTNTPVNPGLSTSVSASSTSSSTAGISTTATNDASAITKNPSRYNGQTVSITGQTFLTGSPPKVLLDGDSGINITGNVSSLEKGYYTLTGLYNSGDNTLNVTSSVEQDVKYTAIETAKSAGVNLNPVSVDGLVATPPKELADQLTSYLSIPYLPKDTPIYPYVVYTENGFYIALSDQNVLLLAHFSLQYSGKDYSFTACAGEVQGTLVTTPIDKIDLGSNWQPDEFNGIIIANDIAPLAPLTTTVKDINANPNNYIFKRVSINGSYVVTTATINYSDIKAPMGIGLLADSFADLYEENSKSRIETIDPNQIVWQLRQTKVTGTVIYPTEQMLKYLDYASPLSEDQAKQNLKPALIVDSLADDTVNVTNISDLNPVTGNPSKYWGKVVEFEGYALGTRISLQDVASAISGTEIPVDVTLYAVGIADQFNAGSQLAIIGLDNDLNKGTIEGKFKFKVAVTQIPNQLVTGVPFANTAFFLLSKEELPFTIPTTTLPTTTTPSLPTTSPSTTTTLPLQTTTPTTTTTTTITLPKFP